jgi:predicted enzyme related to lactoylglutathione lyase
MARIVGIGGIYLFSADADGLADWYQRVLGLSLTRLSGPGIEGAYYQELYYRADEVPEMRRHTVFAIFPADPNQPSGDRSTMINYQVDDLVGFTEKLAANAVAFEPIVRQQDAEGYGLFTRLQDPDGNQIELWQHLEA